MIHKNLALIKCRTVPINLFFFISKIKSRFHTRKHQQKLHFKALNENYAKHCDKNLFNADDKLSFLLILKVNELIF